MPPMLGQPLEAFGSFVREVFPRFLLWGLRRAGFGTFRDGRDGPAWIAKLWASEFRVWDLGAMHLIDAVLFRWAGMPGLVLVIALDP